jgi:hypothetical protein
MRLSTWLMRGRFSRIGRRGGRLPSRGAIAGVFVTVLFAGIAIFPSTAQATVAPANDMEYDYSYTLSTASALPPQPVLRMAVRNFGAYFPFSGCPSVIQPGDICPLHGPNGNNPIRVESITATSFTFRSLPGHLEGADRLIKFSFVQEGAGGPLFLEVHASGPASAGAAESIVSGAAKLTWGLYADKLVVGLSNGDENSYPGPNSTVNSDPLSAPAVEMNSDGRLEAFALGDDGQMHHAYQTYPAGGWSSWSSFGGSLWSGPSVVRNSDGRLEVFAIGSDYSLQHAWQKTPGGTWSGWSNLSSGGHNLLYASAVRNRDGRLEIFALADNGQLWHIFQTVPGGVWSAWGNLGGFFESPPTVTTNSDGRLEVFELDSNFHLEHAWQTPAGNFSGWSTLGTCVLQSDPTVMNNYDGRLEVFGVGEDGALDHAWQTSPGGGWSGWSTLGGTLGGAPAVGMNADGRLEEFALDKNGSMDHIWQESAGAGASAWGSLGGTLGSTVAATQDFDGRVELFAIGLSGDPFHIWQTVGGNPVWSGWSGF